MGYTVTEAYDILFNGAEIKPYTGGKLNIALLGYVNNVYDSYVSMSTINRLREMDVNVITFDMLPDDAVNAMSLVAACDYTVRLREGYAEKLGTTNADFMNGLVSYIANGNLEIVKKTKKGERLVDLKPLIFDSAVTEDGEGIFLKLSSGSANNIKPELVLEAYCNSMGKEFPAFGFAINREEVYADKGSEQAHDFVTLESFGEDIE